MDRKERYREVYETFKDLCAKGSQPGSFHGYCMENGVDSYQMRRTLKDGFTNIRALPGYMSVSMRCSRVYHEFRSRCIDGPHPGKFTDYYRNQGITRRQMNGFLYRNGLKVRELPGFAGSRGCRKQRYVEIPFEEVIFEEAGFLPAGDTNVITVKVDGHAAVSFPADTDVDVIARFVMKIGKEGGDVES